MKTLDYKNRYLVIPDLQIPFEHPKALEFCKYIQKYFRIPKENILNLGDELDMLNFGSYEKDPDGDYTINQELDESINRLKDWAKAFPIMRLCTSNHQARYWKKAFGSGIPKRIIKDYKSVIEAPDEWLWKDHWLIKTKHPFMIQHGCGYSGVNAHRSAAIDNTISTIIGHLHSKAGISYIHTRGTFIWGCNAGSLINEQAYAFNYAKHARYKACNGVCVVLNNGLYPIWIPLEG